MASSVMKYVRLERAIAKGQLTREFTLVFSQHRLALWWTPPKRNARWFSFRFWGGRYSWSNQQWWTLESCLLKHEIKLLYK